MIKAKNFNRQDAIQHAFFTRQGGVSEGIYESLNCGYGSEDDQKNVAANRAIAMEKLGVGSADMATLHQFHSAQVVTVNDLWSRENSPKADGMVTKRRGVALGVLTADCAPVLFADPVYNVVGVAHAGWRGSMNGILDATIEAMEDLGAKRNSIWAALGPCIRQISYEVGKEFKTKFTDANPSNESFFRPAPRKHYAMFDLAGFIIERLNKLEVGYVEDTEIDTYTSPEEFFSYRRSKHRGERDYGRGLSVVILK